MATPLVLVKHEKPPRYFQGLSWTYKQNSRTFQDSKEKEKSKTFSGCGNTGLTSKEGSSYTTGSDFLVLNAIQLVRLAILQVYRRFSVTLSCPYEKEIQ